MRILFFDGHCSLCNRLVDWLMRNDRDGGLYYASLQGETAKKMIPEHVKDPVNFNTVVYWRADGVLERSDAVIYVLSDLGIRWKFVKLVLIVPRVIRDFAYNLIARNRYQFFERRKTCRVPEDHEKKRLLL